MRLLKHAEVAEDVNKYGDKLAAAVFLWGLYQNSSAHICKVLVATQLIKTAAFL